MSPKKKPPRTPPATRPHAKGHAKSERPIGRPIALTPEVQEKICKIVEQAGTYEDAAVVAGVAISTFMDWKRRGELARQAGVSDVFAQLLDALDDARRRRRLAMEAQVRAHGRKDWRAIIALGERIERHRFRPPAVTVQVAEEMEAALERIEQEFAGEPELLERVLRVIAGEARTPTAEQDAGAAGRANPSAGGEAVQPEDAAPEAEDVPRARG